MTTTLRVLLVLVAMVAAVRGSCSAGRNADADATVCVVDGEEIPVGVTKITAACNNCTCHLSGYQCCGVGVKAGVGPEGAATVNIDGCDYYA